MDDMSYCEMCWKETSDLTPVIIYPHPTMTGTRLDVCDECLKLLMKTAAALKGEEDGHIFR